MSSVIIVIASFSLFALGYTFYSKYLSSKIFGLDDIATTPAHSQNDGVDFVPTKKHILFGHHFTSIAGAAPIIGPCIAVYWGWLPAVIWVVLGTIFMGAVHDFGKKAPPLSNLYLTLIKALEVPAKQFSDSSGTIREIIA